MNTSTTKNMVYNICGKTKAGSRMMPAALVRNAVVEQIKKSYPDWKAEGYICLNDLNQFRMQYVQSLLESEKGELTTLDHEVLESLQRHETLSSNVDAEFEEDLTLGGKMADGLASFGGSWPFIIIFASILFIWIVLNSFLLLKKPFDPYPFILLNLVLSCLAAIHSPVLVLILSIAAGALGAIIVIFFQKAAIVIAGFAAGDYIVLTLFDQVARLPAQMAWLPYIIGGIVGAITLFFVFDWALIFLSTLAGATLIVQMVAFNPWIEIGLFLALVIAGMVFQAKTMPGGKAAVYTGILPYTQNETGLAVVLGHEVAHALVDHGNERMSDAMVANMGSMALSVALSRQPQQTQQLFMTVYGAGANVGFLLPYSRLHESEADRIGLTLMAHAGHDPCEAVPFWERMSKQEGQRPPLFRQPRIQPAYNDYPERKPHLV